jgi:signal transduction histidine kinase
LERITDGVLAVDADLRYTYLNGGAERILDADSESLLGTALWDPLPETAVETGRPHIERALSTDTAQSFQVDLGDGRPYAVRVHPDDTGLSVVLTELADRNTHEESLGRLHEATRRMLLAETPEQVADLISRAAVQILDLPINDVFFYDSESESLVSVAQSEGSRAVLGEPPTLGHGLAWEAYQTGEMKICSDLGAEAGLFDESTPFRSELLLPLGGHGVFVVASTELAEFSEADITLAKLLAANARVALDQVASENRLAQQRDNLELLTRMMSHDIRNDLQVVGAIAEILGESVEGTQQEYVEKIRRNTAAAVELTTSAQELTEAMLRLDTAAKAVPLGEILQSEITEVSSQYPAADITVDGEIPAVSVLADEMLDSVFRNVLKNAIQHNTSEQPAVTVSVTADADTVVVRIADNGPGIADERKEDIFGRGERGMSSHGTGIGLYLVQTLTEQYGGRVWVEDNDPTGAVFVVQLDRAGG